MFGNKRKWASYKEYKSRRNYSEGFEPYMSTVLINGELRECLRGWSMIEVCDSNMVSKDDLYPNISV